MPALGPYEAGLTPEERAALLLEPPPGPRPRLLGNAYSQRGANTRFMVRNPIASIIASTLLSSKHAAVRFDAFGDELCSLLTSGEK